MMKDGVVHFFVLSGEHEQMAEVEVVEMLTLYNNTPKKIVKKNRILIIETKYPIKSEMIERLSLTKYVGEIIEEVDDVRQYEKIINRINVLSIYTLYK